MKRGPFATLLALSLGWAVQVSAGQDNAVHVAFQNARCEISLTGKSTIKDLRSAEAVCKASGFPTVYLIRR